MELLILDSRMQAKSAVPPCDSIIWAERFSAVDEFEIQTGRVDYFMELLPEGTVITMDESPVPMIVETHEIVRSKDKPAVLVIKGRGFESILDRRVALQGLTEELAEWKVVAKIPSDAAHYIINKICVQGVVNVRDIFPSSVVQFPTPADYLNTTGPNREFVIPRGNLLAAVLGLIQTESKGDPTTTPPTPEIFLHGIRAVRPNTSATAVAIQIYTGQDRSSTIVLSAERSHLDNGKYLFSKKGSATDVYIVGQKVTATMSAGEEKSGLDRRVMLVDGSSSNIDDLEVLRLEGSRALSEAQPTAIFDGSINEDLSPYRFGVDYGLGDIVTLKGDYGLDRKARVTEYIRSDGPDGRKSFPTLVAIDRQETA